jgi:hypothetical protein
VMRGVVRCKGSSSIKESRVEERRGEECRGERRIKSHVASLVDSPSLNLERCSIECARQAELSRTHRLFSG